MTDTELLELDEAVPWSGKDRTEEDVGQSTVEAAGLDEEDTAGVCRKRLDAESLFAAELSTTTVLTRSDEEVLARKIVRARKRVRAIARRSRRVSRAALSDGGRGVVAPEDGFREREAVIILDFARQALEEPRLARTTGLGNKALWAFVADLSAALADYRVLRDQMVHANVRLVKVLARRYRHPSLTFLDLFQEGTIGLLRAIEKYDPERNIKFSTYAAWWIWQQLGRAVDTQGALIRTPVHWNQFRRRLGREARERAGGHERAVSYDELGAIEGIDPARLQAMAQVFRFVSTDAPVGTEDDRPLEALLPGDEVEPEDRLLKTALREHLELALSQLPDREGLILRQRFGLQEDGSQTLETISVRLGVSRERVRQLESRALKRLKAVCTLRGLQEYLYY
jgi:RNA polymerase primary sigma factor